MRELPCGYAEFSRELFDSPSKHASFLYALSAGVPHRGMRANLLKCTPEYLADIYGDALCENPFCEYGFVLRDDRYVSEDVRHFSGFFYMQEPSASVVVEAFPPKNGDKVLDACAAPGGKTGQICALDPDGIVISNEYDRKRADVLCENVERLGIRNCVVTSVDTSALSEKFVGYFDRVYVDAPCSGEGMFRKESAAIVNWSEDNVKKCADRSASILENCSKTVRPGGYLAYSTCTFNTYENERTIDAFLTKHPEFELVEPTDKIKAVSDRGINFAGALHDFDKAVRIFPTSGAGEGHFAVCMRKADGESSRVKEMKLPRIKQKSVSDGCYSEWTDEDMFGEYLEVGRGVNIVPAGLPDMSGLWVLACGVPFLNFSEKAPKPQFAFVRSLKKGHIKKAVELSADSASLRAYLRGEEFKTDVPFSSYAAVTVDGYPVGAVKISGGVAKNHLPKGLRFRF